MAHPGLTRRAGSLESAVVQNWTLVGGGLRRHFGTLHATFSENLKNEDSNFSGLRRTVLDTVSLRYRRRVQNRTPSCVEECLGFPGIHGSRLVLAQQLLRSYAPPCPQSPPSERSLVDIQGTSIGFPALVLNPLLLYPTSGRTNWMYLSINFTLSHLKQSPVMP